MCSKTFGNKYQLRIHLQKMHKNENLSDDENVALFNTVEAKNPGKVRSIKSVKTKFGFSFRCSECNREYGSKKSLELHMSVHKGRTKCHICNRILSRKYELKVHLRKAHGI